MVLNIRSDYEYLKIPDYSASDTESEWRPDKTDS